MLKHLAHFTKQLGLFQDTSMHAHVYKNAHSHKNAHKNHLNHTMAIFSRYRQFSCEACSFCYKPEFTGEAKFVLHQLISKVQMYNTLKLCFVFIFFTNPHQYVKVSISVVSHLLCFLWLKPEWKMPSLLYTLSGYKYIRHELPGVTANLFSGSAALLCAKFRWFIITGHAERVSDDLNSLV